MPPSIRYASTSDEVRIAYATIGEGAPLLCLPPLPFSHLRALWDVPGQRRWYEALARRAEVTLYDGRGCGMSERAAAEFGVEAQLRDLEAVLGRIDHERVALCGFFNSSPAALAYAALHPERVSHLVLWGGFARGLDVYMLPIPEPTPEQAQVQWRAAVETAARSWTAAAGDEALATAAYFRESVAPEAALRCLADARAIDVRELLARVEAPTLVVQRRDSASQRVSVAQDLASGIRGAELVLLPGDAASPFSGDIDGGVAAVASFLGLPVASSAARWAGARGADGALDGLTPREREVLTLLARGRANKEIALALDVSIHTVERHLTNLYAKIDCRSRTEAVAFAIERGLG